jgi:hypothetical protein
MLGEMSLISVIAAISLVYNFFSQLNFDRPFPTHFVVAALVPQVLGLYWDYSRALIRCVSTKPSARVQVAVRYGTSWIGIVAVWFVWNWGLGIHLHRIWPFGPIFQVEWRFWGLMFMAVIFERLGAKQWESIIGEQTVLLRDKQEDLRKLMGTDSSAK